MLLPSCFKSIILVLLLSSISYAETYQWEDENGIHFSDNPASVPTQKKVIKRGEMSGSDYDNSRQALVAQGRIFIGMACNELEVSQQGRGFKYKNPSRWMTYHKNCTTSQSGEHCQWVFAMGPGYSTRYVYTDETCHVTSWQD